MQEVSTSGQIRFKDTHHPCRLTIYKTGRRHCALLPDDGGKRRRFPVARVVLLAFVGEPPNPKKSYACHRNDVCSDDRLKNLYWATPRENRVDAWANGRHKPGRYMDTPSEVLDRVRAGYIPPREPVFLQEQPNTREIDLELYRHVYAVMNAGHILREHLRGTGSIRISIKTRIGKWKLFADTYAAADVKAIADKIKHDMKIARKRAEGLAAAAAARTPQGAAAC
jgi:hypothetical protein